MFADELESEGTRIFSDEEDDMLNNFSDELLNVKLLFAEGVMMKHLPLYCEINFSSYNIASYLSVMFNLFFQAVVFSLLSCELIFSSYNAINYFKRFQFKYLRVY